MAGKWPACTYRQIPWQQQVRAGSKADRTVRSIKVCIPAKIAELEVPLAAQMFTQSESAIREITELDATYGSSLVSLNQLLIRVESIASSKIENISASSEDYARALYGNKSNSSANEMVAGTRALETFINSTGKDQKVSSSNLKSAHHELMHEVVREREYAGKYRTMQNWVSGSDYSPLGALFIPPPPEEVGGFMEDLFIFSNRDDIPVLIQAAIAHAQFETIHPFTDGNGRIGRALVNAILRRRKITTKIVIPMASFFTSNRESYFQSLNEYRNGNLDNLLLKFIASAEVAARESRESAKTLVELSTGWVSLLGRVRSTGATSKVLEYIQLHPVISTEQIIQHIGGTPASTYNALARLKGAGIISSISDSKRSQVWAATAVLDELEDLNNRIAHSN